MTTQERREALAQAVQAAAEWGYRMAQLGVTPCPVPFITWDDEGRPHMAQHPQELAPVVTEFCRRCKALPGERHVASRHKVSS